MHSFKTYGGNATTDISSCIQLYNWIVGDSDNIYRDAKGRVIYPALFTDPEGDICVSIYQISWIKMKKELFVN